MQATAKAKLATNGWQFGSDRNERHPPNSGPERRMVKARQPADLRCWGSIGVVVVRCVVGPSASINVMRWFEHRRGFAVGVVTAGEGIGGTIWPPVFRHFNETVGWRDTFMWFGVFVLVTALPLSVVLWRRMPARDAGSRDEGGRIVDSHAESPTIRQRAISLSTFDSTGSYTPAFLVGATFNVANLIIVVGLINRTRAGGGAPMRPAPA